MTKRRKKKLLDRVRDAMRTKHSLVAQFGKLRLASCQLALHYYAYLAQTMTKAGKCSVQGTAGDPIDGIEHSVLS